MIAELIFNDKTDLTAPQSRLFASILSYIKEKNIHFYYKSKILEYYGDLKKLFVSLQNEDTIIFTLRSDIEVKYVVVFWYAYQKLIKDKNYYLTLKNTYYPTLHNQYKNNSFLVLKWSQGLYRGYNLVDTKEVMSIIEEIFGQDKEKV